VNLRVSRRKKKKQVGDQVTFVFPYEDDKIIYDWLNAQNNATNALRVLIKEVIRINGGIFDMSTVGVLNNNQSPLLNKQLYVQQYNDDNSSGNNINSADIEPKNDELKNELVNKKEHVTSSVNNEDKSISSTEKKKEKQNSNPGKEMDENLNNTEEKNKEIVVNLDDLL
jgi:hypothetical protein